MMLKKKTLPTSISSSMMLLRGLEEGRVCQAGRVTTLCTGMSSRSQEGKGPVGPDSIGTAFVQLPNFPAQRMQTSAYQSVLPFSKLLDALLTITHLRSCVHKQLGGDQVAYSSAVSRLQAAFDYTGSRYDAS